MTSFGALFVLLWLLLTLGPATGMLYVVPLSLRLTDPGGPGGPADPAGPRRTARLRPLIAAPGALSLFLPHGALAAVLAATSAAAALILAVRALAPLPRILPRLVSGKNPGPASVEIAVLFAPVGLALVGAALVTERSGHRLLGIDPSDLQVALWHFQFVGCAAVLVAGLVHRAASRGALVRCAAYSVPLGLPLALLGYFAGPWAWLVGLVVLAGGLWSAALLTMRELHQQGGGLIAGTALALTALITLGWASSGPSEVVVTGEPTGIVVLGLILAVAAAVFGMLLCLVAARSRLNAGRAAAAGTAAVATAAGPAGYLGGWTGTRRPDTGWGG
ncbi:YndJ family transporter [Streptomyces sp. NBC_00454]|uniref:YndJ family transporter n=1 Tax=Streptomyces sp. NBC_00454 TaxID=2975747 RepID=UPI0030E3EDCD